MTQTLVDYDTLDRTLAAIAEEFPDKVYAAPILNDDPDVHGCMYAQPENGYDFDVESDGDGYEPRGNLVAGCMIGLALHRLGYSLEELHDIGEQSALHLENVWADDNTAHLAFEVQALQDHNATWSDAYTRGKQEAERNR